MPLNNVHQDISSMDVFPAAIVGACSVETGGSPAQPPLAGILYSHSSSVQEHLPSSCARSH